MEEKVVSFDELKRKLKVEETKRKVANAAKGAFVWCLNNKEFTLGLAASGAAGLKIIGRLHKAKVEDHNTYCKHWDPRAGEYAESRRKLTKRERLELLDRYNAGENKMHILNDMGLLK